MKHAKNAQRLLRFCQSAEVSPNLVTLFITHRLKRPSLMILLPKKNIQNLLKVNLPIYIYPKCICQRAIGFFLSRGSCQMVNQNADVTVCQTRIGDDIERLLNIVNVGPMELITSVTRLNYY